ncbi:MAG TPA: ABC transporter permease, partial [Catenuloplanes sp.]
MSALAGTGALVRLALRRDRVILPIWVLLLGGIPIVYASSIAELYPTAAARAELAAVTATNTSQIAMLGPIFGDSLGALTAWRSGILMLGVAMAALFTVIRHTRADEEAGRSELLGATVVGRLAPVTAALTVAFAGALAVAAVATVGLIGAGLPAAGSLQLGLAMAVPGLAFAAVAAAAAQLTEAARPARGLALAALGGAYLLRAAGDTSVDAFWLSWLSPLGWAQQARPFAGFRPSAFALAAVFTVVLVAGALALAARRDLGAGLLPARPGPAAAAPGLRTPLALAWRLHRGALAGWVAGFAVLGAVLGGATRGAVAQLGDSEELRELMGRLGGGAGGQLETVYLAAILSFFGLAAAGFAVQATLRLRGEETAQRLEPLLATATGRLAWASSHLVFALLGPALALLAAGLGAGVAYGLGTGELGNRLPGAVGGALVQLPAVWVLAGLAVALFGLLPRLTAASWAVLVTCIVLGQ